MICKIVLLKNGSSSIPEVFYVESESKELALNALVIQNKINLNSYSMVLVIDMSLNIIKDVTKENRIKPIIQNDPNKNQLDLLLNYDKTYFKDTQKFDDNLIIKTLENIIKGIF